MQDVNKECCVLSSPKYSSAFQVPDVRKLESVNPKALEKELSQKAPVLLSVLKAACGSMYADSRHKTPSAVMAASIHVNAHNKQL